MLELRPVCEHCGRPLPPESPLARICSFECTFCAECVERMLHGVCPNCGGGFVPRPIRPRQDWNGGNHLGRYPASEAARHRPVDSARHAALLARLKGIPPEER
jgi:uncharacterized protein